VAEPNMNDVLSGRGGRINAHPGNVQFRDLVRQYRTSYLSADTKKLDKVKIAAKIVHIVRSMDPPGRFLKEEKKGGWVEIGDEKARKKAGQAMREKAEEVRKEIQHLGQITPQKPLPGFNSPSIPSPPTNFHSPNMAVNPNYLQMQPPYAPQNHMQQLHQMNQINQMHNFQRPSSVMSGTALPNPAQAQKKSGPRPGLMTGNAVAFDREFNRMSSSDSASGNYNSLRMSSLDSSMNASSSTVGKSSMSSHSDSLKSNDQRQIQIMDTINDEVGRQDSIASAWDDSWDQGPMNDNQSVDTASRSIESERRRQFRKLKSEPSCLPSQLSGTTNILNENDLMKESLASMQMQSVEMQSMEMRRPPTSHPPPSQDKISVDRLSINDMKMDSVNELILDTLIPGAEEESEGSIDLKLAKKKDSLTSSGDHPVLAKPNAQTRAESGVSGISGITDTSAKSSDSPWTAAIPNNTTTMPSLPPVMTDQHRQRFFSDYSTRSQSMLSDISVSMNMLDLTENIPNDRDESQL